MDIPEAALATRKGLQMFGGTLVVETQLDKVLEIPSVFPAYEVGKAYKTKDVFSYGTNAVGDPQLYQVLQDHTSASEWTPEAIGITEYGYPTWVQPLGSTDAYNKGDIVSYNGKLYRSTIDGNVWSPEAYPAGWESVTA